MIDIVSLGELLVDFAPAGERTYQANAGGAPANVLAAAARLGKKAACITMVGQDGFGDMLVKDLAAAGVDTSAIRRTKDACTTLAFVSLDAQGDRSFTFVRRPGADMLLSVNDVDFSLIESAKIFGFGSVSMTDEPSRSATLEAAKFAKEHGVTTAWGDDRTLVVKNEEELEFLTGISDLESGSQKIMEYGPKLVFITLGPKGCFFRCKAGTGRLPAYDTKVVDTTGSGDAFLGGVLTAILDRGIERLDSFTLEEMNAVADYGSRAGSLAASQKGGIPSMPDRAKMEECGREIPKLAL